MKRILEEDNILLSYLSTQVELLIQVQNISTNEQGEITQNIDIL